MSIKKCVYSNGFPKNELETKIISIFYENCFFEIACYGSGRIRFWWHRPRENRSQCASENVGAPD